MQLFHATSEDRLESILSEGLRGPSYWTRSQAVADYYLNTVTDEGLNPVLIRIAATDLDASSLEPDFPGIEEPITSVLGESEEKIWKIWGFSTKTWQASLEIVECVRHRGVLPAAKLFVDVDDELIPLSDYVELLKPKQKAMTP